MNTDVNENKPEVINLKKILDYQPKAVLSRILLKNESGNITLFAFDKGEGLSEHTAPFDAHVNVIEGEAEIEISHQSYKLCAGDSVIMPAGKPHALKAIERFKMILTMIRPPISK